MRFSIGLRIAATASALLLTVCWGVNVWFLVSTKATRWNSCVTMRDSLDPPPVLLKQVGHAKRINTKAHQKSFSESRRMVTGPSLVNSTAIMA